MILEANPDLVATSTVSGFVLSMNPAGRRLLGMGPDDDVTGLSVLDLCSPETVERMAREIVPTVVADGSWRGEASFLARDGREIPVSQVVVAHRGPDGIVQFLSTIASDVSDRRRSEAEIRRRGAYLTALHETTIGLLDHMDIEELLEAIVQRAASLAATEHAYLYLVHPEENVIETHVVTGVFERWGGYRMARGEGMAGRVWLSGQPLMVEDYDTWEGRSPGFPTGIFRAVLGVPLMSDDDVVGVIGLGHIEEGRAFGPDEVDVLDAFARLASIALQNARLYDSARKEIADRRRAERELRRREAVLGAVAVAAERFLAEGPREDVIDEVIAALGEAADVSRVYVFENVTSDDGRVAGLQRHEWVAPGIEPQIDNPALRPFIYEDVGQSGWVATQERGEVVHAHVRDLPDGQRPFLEAQAIRSLVVVPVFTGGRWWGFIGFDECRAERAWSAAEIDGLVAAGSTLGAAIERERAQEALRQTQDNYRRLVELSPDGIFVHDAGRVVFANSRFAQILGAPEPADLIGRPALGFVLPGSRPLVVERIRQALEEGRSSPSIEEKLVRLDGTVIDVEVCGSPLTYQGKQAVQVVVRDITDRKLAQGHLREAEARYRALVERLPMATWVEVPDPMSPIGFTSTYVSPQIEDIVGYSAEEWRADAYAWRGRLHPDDRERAVADWAESVERGGPFVSEYRLIARDGGVVWVHEEAVLVADADGAPRFWQGLLADVTERRRAEDALRAAEAKYRTLVERIPAVTYVVIGPDGDPATPYGYVSPQIEGLIGCTPEQWLASPTAWRAFVHPEDLERVIAEWADCAEARTTFASEYRVMDPEGRPTWIRDEAVLVQDQHGAGRFWQGIMTDISEQRATEEALRSAFEQEQESTQRLRALDEMKNTFLAAVSHELRTPLSTILGLAVTLERPDLGLSPEESADLLGRLTANARKLDRLLSDLLDLDRLGRGIVEPRRRPTDVGALARQVAEGTDALREHPTRLDTASVVVDVDAAKVERIVENLVFNAARHTAPGTLIRIGVRAWEEGVLIQVDDEGPGVPDELREAIFEPFRQVPGRHSHSPGVGVGLSLVSRFAELHGGRAWVEPRAGGGSSFRVYLPESAPAA